MLECPGEAPCGPWDWRGRTLANRRMLGQWEDRREDIPNEKHSTRKGLEAEATWKNRLPAWLEGVPRADRQAPFPAPHLLSL